MRLSYLLQLSPACSSIVVEYEKALCGITVWGCVDVFHLGTAQDDMLEGVAKFGREFDGYQERRILGSFVKER